MGVAFLIAVGRKKSHFFAQKKGVKRGFSVLIELARKAAVNIKVPYM